MIDNLKFKRTLRCHIKDVDGRTNIGRLSLVELFFWKFLLEGKRGWVMDWGGGCEHYPSLSSHTYKPN
jgi:hypothetical protein